MSQRPAFIYHPDYEMDIGQHVFPTVKFRLIKEQLLLEGLIRADEVEEPPLASDEDLLTVLDPAYLDDMRHCRSTERTIYSELPITDEIINGCIRCAGGTILAVERAVKCGGACHFGGGFHHGFADHAEGFCYINDVAIGAAVACARGWAKKVAIIDADVHQGNGTARIFQSNPNVFTFSIHQELLYPPKQKGDLDVGLPNLVGDDEYCKTLERAMQRILRDFQPDLVIYVAGADPFEDDQLGDLGLSFEGMKRRDRIVIRPLAHARIPFATVTAGGYARKVEDTVELHVQTVRVAIDALENL